MVHTRSPASLLMMVGSPLQWQMQAPTQTDADRLFDELVAEYLAHLDANDLRFQIEASRDYNPAPHLERIQTPLLALNSADDAVNPPELGILEREIQRLPRGRTVVLPVDWHTQGHRSHSFPELWLHFLAELLDSSSPFSQCT